jgi:hypothetical protein
MGRPSGGGRPTPISYFELDVRWLKRQGALRPGTLTPVEEWINGRLRGQILVVARAGNVELVAGVQRQFVPIGHTAQHISGARAWFQCDCGKRAAILYGPRFLCRKCRGIAYPSQRETLRDRKLRRARKVRMILGGSASMLDPFPDKPKGMHWRSYHRLWAQYLGMERELISAWRAMRIGARVQG